MPVRPVRLSTRPSEAPNDHSGTSTPVRPSLCSPYLTHDLLRSLQRQRSSSWPLIIIYLDRSPRSCSSSNLFLPMSTIPSDSDFEIHVDQDCLISIMEEPTHIDQPGNVSAEEPVVQPAPEASPAEHENVDDAAVVQNDTNADVNATSAETTPSEDDASPAPEPGNVDKDETIENAAEEPDLSGESPENLVHEEAPEDHAPIADEQECPEADQSSVHEPEQAIEGQNSAVLNQDDADNSSEVDQSTTDAQIQDEEAASILEAELLERRHSVRTEALIQAAARAVVSLREGGGEDAAEDRQHDQDPDESLADSSTTNENEENEGADDADETVHLHHDDDAIPSRPESSASHSLSSPTERSSVGDGTESGSHRGFDDDVFSDRSLRSPRSSVHSPDQYFDDDAFEQMTEKGDQSPYVRSRVTSGVSVSGASEVSDLSRLSRYEKEDFVPTSRNNRPTFRSPSSVRAIQMSSPTPSVYASPKRPIGFPTTSRHGSPQVSGQFSPKGRSTPSRFKRPDPAPLVLLHVTLLPLRWGYGDVMNHFEAKKVPPMVFSSEGIKNLRGAWRQLQDRLGDTVLERGILLPHPQNDYEILEERMLEALELPLRRRARILECGHYLGPSNVMANDDDIEDDFEYGSDAEDSEPETKPEKRHWCKTCKGDIKYEELGSERMFRIKVYASNGLMSAGAWEACWKEMERVDIEVEPIIDSTIQNDLAKLSAAFDHEHQQQLEAEQNQQAEEEQRLQLEIEQRLSLEEERHQLELQRQQFEEDRRRAAEETERRLEEERKKFEEEQRQRLEEERRQQFEEERQLLEAQRQQFEEQRLELEQQRKLVEDEQRQHLEEARRQELEEEQRLIEEQRQQLEEARQQFEEERRQRLEEEEELRRLQREEDEQKQIAAPRATSRTSYVEDDLASPPLEGSTTDLDGRRRDSDRLREIYGAHSRASSDALANTSSPSIHIHVDSGKQREEEQNSRQLTTIPAPRDSISQATTIHDARHHDSYMPPPPLPTTPEQAYPRHEEQRRSLDTASLPELLGETIRVLLQDPKNVAIAVLVVFIAMLAGFTKREEHGVEIYKPQQHYQHHQLDSRDPVGQVIMNTPTQLVETVYKTVTSEVPPQKIHATREVEIVYHTVTQQPIQETATRVVETIYSTVTQSLVQPPPAQAAIEDPAAPRVASELPSTDADPSVDLTPLLFDTLDGADSVLTPPPPFCIAPGLDPFVCPAASVETDTDIESPSNKPIFKDTTEADLDTQIQAFDPITSAGASMEIDDLNIPSIASIEEDHGEIVSITTTSTMQEYQVTTMTETVTETIYATATPSLA